MEGKWMPCCGIGDCVNIATNGHRFAVEVRRTDLPVDYMFSHAKFLIANWLQRSSHLPRLLDLPPNSNPPAPATSRAVQDYDLYLICYDYFELLWLYYHSPHILSSLITVEYDTIWLRIQYDTVVIFNHNNNILKCHRSAQFWYRSDLYVPYLVM